MTKDNLPAVIILNWNGEKLLREFLPTVVAYTPTHLARIIVADNGSNDGSLQLLKTEFPQVETIAFSQNHGFAQGYNLAIQQINAPLTLLLNSDVAVTHGWLEPLLAYMEQNPDVAACQPKILSYRNKNLFEYAGAAGGYIDRNGYPYCRGRIFNTIETDRGQYNSPRNDLFWATGAALLVRTPLYIKAGGLDPQFFAHMEEIDLCWRLKLLGFKIAAVPQSVVHHLGGASLSAANPQKTYLNFRNNLLMMHKNIPAKSRRAILLKRRILDTLAFAMFLITGKHKHAAAIIRAHRHFAKMRRNYTTCPSSNLLSPSLPDILSQYYLHGNRTFSKITH